MIYLILKFSISAAILVLISEVAKRSSILGAILASLPLVSLLAMIWLYMETKNITAVTALSNDIFWMVLPSLVLFITLPLLLGHKVPFYTALALSSVLMVVCYILMTFLLRKLGWVKF
jgi:hypothetical protein